MTSQASESARRPEHPAVAASGAELAILRAGAVLAAAGTLAVLVVHVVAVLVLDRRVEDIDAEQEGNAIAWLSSSVAVSASVAALLLAVVPPVRRGLLVVLGAGLAFLSLSEATQVHERLGYHIAQQFLGGSDEWASRAQVLAIMPVLALVFLLTFALALRARGRFRVPLLFALGLLVSSLVIEQLAGPLTNRLEGKGTIWPDAIRNGLEEGLEVGGWTLLAASLFALLLAGWAQGARRPLG